MEEDKKAEEKKEEGKKEDIKEEEKKEELKTGKKALAISVNPRRRKTDGILPVFGAGDIQAVEDRKNRLLKRLNKSKEVNKKREEQTKYRKSVDITLKAEFLQQQLSDKKDG